MNDGSILNDGNRLYLNNVCSRLDLIREHIQRHSLEVDEEQYLRIADAAFSRSLITGGRRIPVTWNSELYGVVLEGDVPYQGKRYKIVRSVIRWAYDKYRLQDNPQHLGYDTDNLPKPNMHLALHVLLGYVNNSFDESKEVNI